MIHKFVNVNQYEWESLEEGQRLGGEREAQLFNKYEAKRNEFWVVGNTNPAVAAENLQKRLDAVSEFEEWEKYFGIYQERTDQSPKERLIFTPEIDYSQLDRSPDPMQDLLFSRQQIDAARQPKPQSQEELRARIWISLTNDLADYLNPETAFKDITDHEEDRYGPVVTQHLMDAEQKIRVGSMVQLYHRSKFAFPDEGFESYYEDVAQKGVGLVEAASDYYPLQKEQFQKTGVLQELELDKLNEYANQGEVKEAAWKVAVTAKQGLAEPAVPQLTPAAMPPVVIARPVELPGQVEVAQISV